MKTPLIVALLASLLVACAGYAPPKDMHVGMPEAEVVQAMGQPTGRYPLPDGAVRLEFARGPYGFETFMVDLDAQGRVLKWEQVLDRWHFDAVIPGMTSEQLLRYIGRPSEQMGMMRDGKIWTYRYFNNDCLIWYAQLDAKGVITAAGYGPRHGCDGAAERGVR
jgi:hypothetical protein